MKLPVERRVAQLCLALAVSGAALGWIARDGWFENSIYIRWRKIASGACGA
jgi:hypothetical protein